MRTTDPSEKLPLPGPWQPAAKAAMADLANRRGVPLHAVAVTRVEPLPGSQGATLDLWLLSGARTWRYRASADGSDVTALAADGAPAPEPR